MRRLVGHPWRMMQRPDGGVVQSGVSMAQGADWFDTRGFITRAVVTKTYFSDDPEWENRAWAKGNVRGICCDVRTYGRYSRTLWRVPVLQRTHGLHDEDVYVPRDAAQNLAPDGGTLSTLPSGEGDGQPTPAENLDGDHVLVGFLEGNPDNPVIFPFCLPHPSSERKLLSASGRVRRIRHAGVSIEWSEDGNLTIDASGAAREKLGPRGKEESNSGTAGQITVTTSDGSNRTSVHLDAEGKIRLGSDPAIPADEPVVLGSLWIEVMGELLTAIKGLTVGTSTGPSTVPINVAAFDAIKAKIDAGQHVSEFIFVKKTH